MTPPNPLALSYVPGWALYPAIVLLMAACAWHAWRARR